MAPQNSPAGDAKASVPAMDINQLAALEAQALENSKKTISAIEEAMAAYEGAKVKPPELQEKYEKYRKLRRELTKWVRDFLTGKEPLTLEQRMVRLQKLVNISLYGDL
jgi:hypothetical protein